MRAASQLGRELPDNEASPGTRVEHLKRAVAHAAGRTGGGTCAYRGFAADIYIDYDGGTLVAFAAEFLLR
jgi:hypothetical protein